jgi:FAD/FMN-containing dehydrogenase
VNALAERLAREFGQGTLGALASSQQPLVEPGSEAEVVELLRFAAREQLRVLPVGSGSTLARHAASFDFALGTRRIASVVESTVGDGTLSASAGTSMHALAELAARMGARLTPDVAHAERATLGGVVAGARSGIDRLRYGPLRMHVLGTRVVQADGAFTKSGGRLVKNVTGYDLHRLYTGSRGTLCVVLEVALRLFPAPERELVLVATAPELDTALRAARDVLAGVARPICVCVENVVARSWTASVVLAGRADVVQHERELVVRALGACTVLEGPAASAQLHALRELEDRAGLRVWTLRTQLARDFERVRELCARLELEARFALHPGLASIEVCAAGATAAAWAELTRGLESHGLSLEPLCAAAAHAHDPLAHVSAPARALMQRVKGALDPNGLFPSLERELVAH